MRTQAAKTEFTSATDSPLPALLTVQLQTACRRAHNGYLLLVIPHIQLRNVYILQYTLGAIKDTRSHAHIPHVPGIIKTAFKFYEVFRLLTIVTHNSTIEELQQYDMI